MFGRGPQPSLFACIHGFRGRAEISACAVADLDENQGGAVLHDKVDFPEWTAVITLREHHSLLFEVLAGALFGVTTTGEICPGIVGHLRKPYSLRSFVLPSDHGALLACLAPIRLIKFLDLELILMFEKSID